MESVNELLQYKSVMGERYIHVWATVTHCVPFPSINNNNNDNDNNNNNNNNDNNNIIKC